MEKESEKLGHTCIRCGKCCSFDFLKEVDVIDIARWVIQERWDILTKVKPVIRMVIKRKKEVPTLMWEVWWSEKSWCGWHERCPWLGRKEKDGKHKCRIEDTKPITCGEYPRKKPCLRMKEKKKR